MVASKIVKDKSCTHVSNMFVVLDDDNNLNKNEDTSERKLVPLGQTVQFRRLGEVNHKLDQVGQLLLEQDCFDDPIRKSGRPKRGYP